MAFQVGSQQLAQTRLGLPLLSAVRSRVSDLLPAWRLVRTGFAIVRAGKSYWKLLAIL